MPDLVVLYEHPTWFEPLFAALHRRGVDYEAICPGGSFDPDDLRLSAPVVFNRIAMSAFVCDLEQPIFWAQALLARWESAGARVLNGTDALSIDMSKARQLSLLSGLGLAVPRTRVVHRKSDIEAAAETIGFPVVLKANIGGAGVVRAICRDVAVLDAGRLVEGGPVASVFGGQFIVDKYKGAVLPAF